MQRELRGGQVPSVEKNERAVREPLLTWIARPGNDQATPHTATSIRHARSMHIHGHNKRMNM